MGHYSGGGEHSPSSYKRHNSLGIAAELIGHEVGYAYVDEPEFSPTHLASVTLNLGPIRNLEGYGGRNFTTVQIAKSIKKLNDAKKNLIKLEQKSAKDKSVQGLTDRRKWEWGSSIGSGGGTSGEGIEEDQPKFPENFYTYKSLYSSASDFALMATEKQVELAEAQEDKIWGFREPPVPRKAPAVDNSHQLFHMKGDWDYRKGTRYLCDMNHDGYPDYLVIDDDNSPDDWIIFINKNGEFEEKTVSFVNPYSDVSRPYLGEYHHDSDGYTQVRTMLIDVNNDSLQDVVWINNMDKSDVWYVGINKIPTENSFNVIKWKMPESLPISSGDPGDYNCYMHRGLLDINGDGYPDYVKAESNHWTVYYGEGISGFMLNSVTINAQPVPLKWQLRGAPIIDTTLILHTNCSLKTQIISWHH